MESHPELRNLNLTRQEEKTMKRLLGLTAVIVLLATSSVAMAADCDGILPEQAYQMLFDDANTYLIDVRSASEYNWIGHPATNLADDPDSGFLEGRVAHIVYKLWVYDVATGEYHMPINKNFAKEVAKAFPKDATLIFMCRSGQRSCDAQHFMLDPANSKKKDYQKILTFTMYNLNEGFEGGRDSVTRHRTLDAGWKNLGLPYQDGRTGIWTPGKGGKGGKAKGH
jgi:rhodanese-related sulfurtransferase